MIKEGGDMVYGIVKSREGSKAIVVIERQTMCGDCHACERLSGKKQCQLTCEVHTECQVGDKVEVQLETEHFLKAAYLMYGIPLLGFIGGLVISLILTKLLGVTQTDLWLIAGMLMGTVLGTVYIKARDQANAYHKYLPVITSKVEK